MTYTPAPPSNFASVPSLNQFCSSTISFTTSTILSPASSTRFASSVASDRFSRQPTYYLPSTMLPHKKKIDISVRGSGDQGFLDCSRYALKHRGTPTLTEEERKLFSLYGKLPTHKNVLTKIQKDRKYFDSGDYALSKAGIAPEEAVGTAIPNPQNIPHASPPTQGLSVSPTNSNSPVKESTLGSEDSNATTDES